jgi:DNA-binding beta-propeller fold protein YncE
MKSRIESLISIFVVLIFLFILSVSCTQQKEEASKRMQETDDNTQEKRGVAAEGEVEVRVGSVIPAETWGSSGKIGISFVRTIGEAEAKDPNLAFYYPSDLVVDTAGNIYVLDSENHRIQKFNPQGIYLETIGREGEGPIEFMNPVALDIDREGNIVVHEPNRYRIHIISSDGTTDKFLENVFDYGVFDMCCHPFGGFVASANIIRPYREGVPVQNIRCLKMYGPEGSLLRNFVDCTDYGDASTTTNNNMVIFDTGRDGSVYVTFRYQNRVEKYTPEGKPLWRASRPLSYKPGFKEGKSRTTRNMTETTVSKNSPCSEDITADAEGRAWVLTLNRQMKGREALAVATFHTGKKLVTKGDTSLRFTDAHKIEIFGLNGDLVDTIPLTHFAESINIFGDNLFLIDKYRGMQVYQYRIVSNN